jgi:hypothetical protein
MPTQLALWRIEAGRVRPARRLESASAVDRAGMDVGVASGGVEADRRRHPDTETGR